MTATTAPRQRAQSAPISRVPYLPGLDGMRALAVVAVMVYHANVDWLHGGFLGVEVFFIISGYLITLLLIAEHERDESVSLGQFWLRRARRLLPALYVMMTAVAVYTALFMREELGKLRGDIISGVLYVANWYQIWTGAGYTAQNEFAPLRHLWSLAVEEQFYLLWPLVMIAVLARGRRHLPKVGMWLFGISFAITIVVAIAYYPGAIGECDVTPDAYWQVGGRCISKLDTLYLGTFSRMSGILMGAGFAMIWRPFAIMRGPMRTKGRQLDLLALVGLVVLALLVWFTRLTTNVVDEGQVAGRFLFQGGLPITGLATLAIIAAVTHQRAVAGKLLGNPVLLWIGTRSYGLYLYHWPIYQIIRKEAGVHLTLAQFVVAMVLTALVTEASFRYIETPIRKGRLLPWWRGLHAAVPGAAERRRRVLGIALVVSILPIYAGISMAVANVQQNEVQEALDENEAATVDLDELVGSTVPVVTTAAPGQLETTVPGGVVDPNATTTTSTTTTLPPSDRIDVLSIGDSVMLGAANALTNLGAVVNAEQNRQGRAGVDILAQLAYAGRLGNVVVIHLGTNGSVSPETYDQMVTNAGDVPLIVFLTIRADRGWTAGNNAAIRALPATHPNVKVLDWETLSASCPGDCFYSDGIHLKPDGQQYYAQLVWQAIGRA